FTTASPQVWLYFYVTGARLGDAVQMNFIRPDGVIYTTYNATVQFTNECFSYVINIAGASAVNYPGTWTVQTFWNQGSAPLFSLNFTLTPSSPPAPTGATPGLYSSGQNVVNGLDKSFQILSDTTGQISAPNAAFVVKSPGWPATVPGAAWIAPSADQGSDRLGCCSNTADTYRMTFTLPANGSGLTLNLTLAADDYVDVLLNGQTVYTHASTTMWITPVNFSISSGFVAGANTLDFAVTNSGGPTGLIVAISETGPGGITFLNQRVSTQDASLSGSCVPPPVSTSFHTTDDTVFLYFEATTTLSDMLSDDWLAPDGTVHNAGPWSPPSAGNSCYFDNFDISRLPSNLLGAWQARVYDNGTLLLIVPFTVGAPGSPTGPASIQIVSGNSQTALVNQSFAAPLVIQVLDSQGNPVSGVPVTWAVSSGSANLFNFSTSTDTNGQAAANVTAGSAAGPVTVTATAGPATAQFNLTVTSGSSSLNAIPGQTLNLTGTFDTSTSVTTTVVFTDGGSYTVSLPPVNVTNNTVSVLVPPYWNPQQGFVAGTLTASVTQQPATGTSTTSAQAIVQVGPLPQTGLPPGTITLTVLKILSQAAFTANQTWNTIQQKSLGLVQAARLNIPALQGDISTMQAQVQAFVSGQVSQVCMGQINGQNICLTADSLAVVDQLYYAFYLGSNSPPGQIAVSSIVPLPGVAAAFSPRDIDIVGSFQSWYSGLVTSTLPQTIRDNAKKLRTITAIMTSLGTLAAIAVGGPVEAPILLGAAVYMAINLGSASTAAALEGAGSEILNIDESDFKQTIGILIDGVKDLLEGIATKVVFTVSGLGEAAENAYEVVKGISEVLNPEDPSSVESETESALAQNLFNTAANLPLTGNWMGTYNRTPSSGCPAYSGLMSMSTTQYSDGTYSGTFTMTEVKIYDSNCKVTETGNITNGGLVDAGKVTGFDPNGNLTFTGSLDWSLDNSLTYGSFTFTGTLRNGSIQGVFDKGGGTFSLH
ncbi:MAG: Ig-like domain-containing protein, partial [Bryobacteraceae bacterium]